MSSQPIERRVSRLENDVSGIYEILSRVELNQDVHSERLDSIEGRLDSMDGRLDSMDGRLGSMDGRLDHLGGQMAIVIDLLEGK